MLKINITNFLENQKKSAISMILALKKKKRRVVIILAFLVLLLLASVINFRLWNQEEKIGWVTDIHSGGSGKRAISETNIVYPIKAAETFNAVMKKMKRNGVTTVISTGDQTSGGDKKYPGKLMRAALENKKIKMLWVYGNHDLGDSMSLLDTPQSYYVYDTKSFRIIVLDRRELEDQISKDQLDWLAEKIAESALPVIIASHAPIIDYDKSSAYPSCVELEKMISSSNNKVKYVLSGHLHKELRANLNGVDYMTAYPLTFKDHFGSYYEISLKEGIVGKNL